MPLLFPQGLQVLLLNSNVGSSLLRKGYVLSFYFYGEMTLAFVGSSHSIKW